MILLIGLALTTFHYTNVIPLLNLDSTIVLIIFAIGMGTFFEAQLPTAPNERWVLRAKMDLKKYKTGEIPKHLKTFESNQPTSEKRIELIRDIFKFDSSVSDKTVKLFVRHCIMAKQQSYLTLGIHALGPCIAGSPFLMNAKATMKITTDGPKIIVKSDFSRLRVQQRSSGPVVETGPVTEILKFDAESDAHPIQVTVTGQNEESTRILLDEADAQQAVNAPENRAKSSSTIQTENDAPTATVADAPTASSTEPTPPAPGR